MSSENQRIGSDVTTSAASPTISIIIPHYSGDVLLTCLDRLKECTADVKPQVIIVDDGPGNDDTIPRTRALFPSTLILKTNGGKGFGAACNTGLRHATGRYAIFLNNDVEVTPGWLQPLIETFEKNPMVGICQPKILSISDRQRFDPGGGAGGQMDFLGYPFALGSIVHATENDHGQYDTPRDLAWAHGSTMAVRMSMIQHIGFFDEHFYMQAEEIDLCFRALIAGYTVRSVPASVAYHHFGWTLPRQSFERFYLSHRNTIVLMLKHWPWRWILGALPLRMGLEIMTAPFMLIYKRKWKHALGIVAALAWVVAHPATIWKRRVGARLKNGDRTALMKQIYHGSILWDYFVRRRKTLPLSNNAFNVAPTATRQSNTRS